jgi:hypothetical protein
MSYLSINAINTSNLSSPSTPSLDQFLDMLGYEEWQILTASFALPSISFIGIILCSLSGWIFFREKFKDPVFFYYRLLCLVYAIHLAHNIPNGLFFSPRYFPQINTYLTSIYQIYYSFMSILLFHFEETLQVGILLMRMKIFSTFVKKHFTASSLIVCVSFFLTCLCIDLPVIFSQQVVANGIYYIFDDTSNSTENVTFYTIASSNFSTTLLGKILGAFTVFANFILSILVGIILNIVSILKYKSHVRQRRERDKTYNRVRNTNPNNQQRVPNTGSRLEIQPYRREMTRKEMNENRAEKNMFYMTLTLCSMSILSRILFIICAIYFIIFNIFSPTQFSYILNIIYLFIQTFVPTSALFVFYFFNKMFRQEFSKIFLSKLRSTTSEIDLKMVDD